MSRCDEYSEQIVKAKDKIRILEGKRPPLIVTNEQRLEARRIEDEIELLKQKLEVLNDRYERSLRRGGC